MLTFNEYLEDQFLLNCPEELVEENLFKMLAKKYKEHQASGYKRDMHLAKTTTDKDKLKELLKHGYFGVRHYAASNPNTPKSALDDVLKNNREYKSVQYAAKRTLGIPI